MVKTERNTFDLQVLQRSNNRVLTATNAEEAWAIFERRRVRVLPFNIPALENLRYQSACFSGSLCIAQAVLPSAPAQ
jgi:hypothetical protein